MMPTKLGQGRAEEDSEMLEQAFVETTDYRMLIEGDGRRVVVGRRGTGKSALALKLAERIGEGRSNNPDNNRSGRRRPYRNTRKT